MDSDERDPISGKETAIYVIPKKNLSRIGFD